MQHPEGRKYCTTKQAYDGVIPIMKLIVFTEHKSDVRRKGVASTIKYCTHVSSTSAIVYSLSTTNINTPPPNNRNVSFEIPTHPLLLSPLEVDLLSYVLLPLAGAEEYPEAVRSPPPKPTARLTLHRKCSSSPLPSNSSPPTNPATKTPPSSSRISKPCLSSQLRDMAVR